MRLAMIGTRGIPASYSGFETAVEYMSAGFVERGHEVTVYCRSSHITYSGKEYKGVRLVKLPTIKNKHFDTIFHSFISILHLLFRRYDVVYVCGVGNAMIAWLPRLTGKKVVLNVDGADWQREKWGKFAKWFLKTSEKVAAVTSQVIIADSKKVREYYKKNYNRDSKFIPYGATMRAVPGHETLKKFGLKPNNYILFVGRLVPENNAHQLIEAYQTLETDKKLVIVGDAPYAEDYIKSIKQHASDKIIFTGYQFGEHYQELSAHADIYVLASSVGGTHPVLVEQMAAGNAVIVNGIATNRETIGSAGLAYDTEKGVSDLRVKLEQLINDQALKDELKRSAGQRAKEHYSWQAVNDQYERLFQSLLKKEA